MALRESTIESGKSALYSSENMSHLSTRVHDSIRHGHYIPRPTFTAARHD